MIQSDALSQCPDHVTDDNENNNIILLPDNIFIKIIDTELHDDIVDATLNNDFFTKAIEALKNQRTNSNSIETRRLDDG